MLIAHRVALDPNNVQATYFACAAGTASFAYNWGIGRVETPTADGHHPAWAGV